MGFGDQRRNERRGNPTELLNPQEWDGALRTATVWLSNFREDGHPLAEGNFDSLNKLKDARDYLERSASALFALHRSIAAAMDAGVDLSMFRSTLAAYQKSEEKIEKVKNKLVEILDGLKNKKVPVVGARLYSDNAIDKLKKRYDEILLSPKFVSASTPVPAPGVTLEDAVLAQPGGAILVGGNTEVSGDLSGAAEAENPFVKALALAENAKRNYEAVRDRSTSTPADVAAAAQSWFAAVREIVVSAESGAITVPTEEISKVGAHYHQAEAALREANARATSPSGETRIFPAPVVPHVDPPVFGAVDLGRPASSPAPAQEPRPKKRLGESKQEFTFREVAYDVNEAERLYMEARDVGANPADVKERLRIWLELTSRALQLAGEIKNAARREKAFEFADESRKRALAASGGSAPEPRREPFVRERIDDEPIDVEIEPVAAEGRRRFPEFKIKFPELKIRERLEKMKFLGQPVTELLGGMVVGGVTKAAARGVLSATGGMIAASVAGAITGATLAVWKQYTTERKAYKKFIEEFDKELIIGDMTPKDVLEKIDELKRDLNAEEELEGGGDEKKKETIRDNILFELLHLKKMAKAEARKRAPAPEGDDSEGEVPKRGKAKRATASDKLNAYLTEHLGSADAERQKLLKDILSSRSLKLNQKLVVAVARGAALGAIGGAVGGWAVEALESAQIENLLGFGGDAALPEADQSVAVNNSVGAPDASVSEGSSGTVLGAESSASSVTGETGNALVEAAPGDVTVVSLPETLPLENLGDNPWDSVRAALEAQGVEPTNGQMLELMKQISADSGISVPEWGLNTGVSHTALPQGFELRISPAAQELIKAMES